MQLDIKSKLPCSRILEESAATLHEFSRNTYAWCRQNAAGGCQVIHCGQKTAVHKILSKDREEESNQIKATILTTGQRNMTSPHF